MNTAPSLLRPAARLLVGIILLSVLTAAAPRAQGLKIGVLDFKQVTERSTAIRDMIKKAEAPLAGKKDQIDAKTDDFRQRKERLDQRRSVLTEDQVKAEEDALTTLREQIQDMQYEVNKQYDKLDQEVMQPAVDRIMVIVQSLARKEGYDLILPSEYALFHSDKIDITPLVIQALDREGAILPTPAMPDAQSGIKPGAKPDTKSDAKASPAAKSAVQPDAGRKSRPAE